jgi:hypothetical protein
MSYLLGAALGGWLFTIGLALFIIIAVIWALGIFRK